MRNSKLTVSGILFVLTMIGLTSCITSATPNPSVPVVMKPGESKTFSVEGPTENTNRYIYDWDLIGNGISIWTGHGKQFNFVADLQKHQLYNRMKLECWLYQYRLGITSNCGGQAGDTCLGWDWFPVSKIEWNIRIVQDGQVWQGNYLIEDNTDISLLNDFTTITGNLYIQNTI